MIFSQTQTVSQKECTRSTLPKFSRVRPMPKKTGPD